MHSLFDPQARGAILARIARLRLSFRELESEFRPSFLSTGLGFRGPKSEVRRFPRRARRARLVAGGSAPRLAGREAAT